MTAETDAMRLVPVKPTPEMIEAGNSALSPWVAPAMHAEDAYRAMLAAAPVSPDSDLLNEAVGLLREMREQARVGYGGAPVMRSKRINLPATLWHRSNAFLSKVEERGHD